MPVELVDVQAGFGGTVPGSRTFVTPADLLDELNRHDISSALVRIVPESADFDVARSNENLFEACGEHPELIPCPVLAPNACGDLVDEATQVDEAIAAGAGAAYLRPPTDYWEIVDWVSDELFGEMQQRRLPAVLVERMVPLVTVGELARKYPYLPFIVAEVSYRNHRTLLPLLQHFPNVHLSIGNTFTAHRGIEFYVDRIGPERLLFGTGLPDAEAGAAVAQLMYADISDEDKALIGAGNFERLRKGIAV